jgi:membrane-associated phospholipid phosphatase
MLLWAGFLSILAGLAALLIDRPLTHFIYDQVDAKTHKALDGITHYAKAGHWLAAAILALIVAAGMRHFGVQAEDATQLISYSLAFIASLTMGSAVLHVIKLVLGRRRPRDDMEMGLYGFQPFAFNLEYNSFPSGHALTICCVAVIFTCVWPAWWPLFFAIASLLAVTRALLTAHFLSDVLIGAGIGLIAAREVLLLGFPGFAPPWF